MSKEGKKEKFFCIANCLPVKSKLGKNNTKVNRLGLGNEIANGSLYGSAYFDEARLNHTKQWVQNLSTVASFDPESTLHDSHLETFKLDDDDELDEKENTFCEKNNACSCSKSHSEPDVRMNDTKDSCDIKVKYMAEAGKCASDIAKHNNSSDDSVAKLKVEDSSILSSSISSLVKVGDESGLASLNNHSKRKRYSRRKLKQDGEMTGKINDADKMMDTCSMSSSCVSLATELVTLDMDACKNLGITIVGHSNGQQGDCGIFVGSVRKGGAAAASGRIEPGDLILEVNGIDLERMTNEKALSVLKSELSKGGLVRILVAKYWDMDDLKDEDSRCFEGMEPLYEPTGSVYSMIPNCRDGMVSDCRDGMMLGNRNCMLTGSRDGTLNQHRNPLKPILDENNVQRRRRYDEAAGASSSNLNQFLRPHSNAYPSNNHHHHHHNPPPFHPTKTYPGGTSSSSSIQTTYPDSGYHEPRLMPPSAMNVYAYPNHPLPPPPPLLSSHSKKVDYGHHRSMVGLPEARRPFLGSELIEWIQGNIMGMSGRNEARNYAQSMLEAGYLSGMDRWFHEDGWYAIVSSSSSSSAANSAHHKSPFY